MGLPPIGERDGSLARQAAPDGADWREVPSADGHSFYVPPEVAHLAAPGMQWDRLEVLVRQALFERHAAGQRPRRRTEEHSASPATLAAAAALAAYIDGGGELDERMSARRLAQLVCHFARQHEIEGAELLDPAGRVLRDMMAHALRAIRQARNRSR